MIELILATANKHKAHEFSSLLDPTIFSVQVASENIDVEETGFTYSENAFIKAQAYYNKFKTPVLADDSGLNVDALPDELGIYSARFGGASLPQSEKNKLLLEKLKGISNRNAHFSCVLCFYLSPSEIFFFEGKVDGTIAFAESGTGGFGYDPLFHPTNFDDPKLSLAMIEDWKMKHSHRAVACQKATSFFKKRNCHS
ncbi:MAG: non-canonical purine NTP pyrophosphatase, RdgB/HAM1 family [Bdellovibrionales bacterium RIFOXYD12_FULL_39_22]|nr:MAG: non-canonical purine NTP pyrophosphatase, RdgB/HAM1 family [Bdellovibrionales bacterium RIFOXYB1_FULL_39_21]OFZ42980.1 MAG: non-canonical purine NTP pyrophosphatase, RdgB/HAM1 family [Bdellovibrionales bacterium RIFOXYC12_FULL_39_17]OFZ50934.1 MAG: non-canonical purine NTP pyrophosphatase, RdgB/HAM1 family [Bdellovibrionales bacterium RIFOXYC1_FULL_39_130]OFZ74062.1 MAG: non-canonical purine NTP pyrophosphatase, RdgB/HAM1 family [Bdellovibrionales bacterium RIFOXYC2_FULL_39_8]OFZ78157.1